MNNSKLAYYQYQLTEMQDRNSIGNARTMGFQSDLQLTPNQYYNCLTMFRKLSLPWSQT